MAEDSELLSIEKECFRGKYLEYFKCKRRNFFQSLNSFRPLWEALQLLNDIWTREFSNLEMLTDKTQLLPKQIFSEAHARYLSAIEFGFSCCIGDAYSVLRDGIEATVHAHKIFKEPAAGEAWTNKGRGEKELAAHDKIFKYNKKQNLFPDTIPAFVHLYRFYAIFCDLATHTSASSIGRSFEDLSTPGNIRWAFHYFETNRQQLAGFLNALLQVSHYMEWVFFDCFEKQLGTDTELVRMRGEFLLLNQQQTHYLMKLFTSGSAS